MQGARGVRGIRGAALVRIATVALVSTGLLAACGGGESDAGETSTTVAAVPEACKAPPVTIDVSTAGDAATSSTFDVTNAVARQVAILPGQMAFDPTELSGLEAEAGVTPLTLYTLYLTDFEPPMTEISGASPNPVVPEGGQTSVALTLVPTKETGFAEGDVVTDAEVEYETTTTFTTLGLTVLRDGETVGAPYTDVTGQATILQLSPDTICVDFDVTLENQGELVYSAKGVVLAPVVRSANAFFYT
jgi:hypothetical protein